MIKRWCNGWYSVTALVTLLSSISSQDFNRITRFQLLSMGRCRILLNELTMRSRQCKRMAQKRLFSRLKETLRGIETRCCSMIKIKPNPVFLNFWILWHCTYVHLLYTWHLTERIANCLCGLWYTYMRYTNKCPGAYKMPLTLYEIYKYRILDKINCIKMM